MKSRYSECPEMLFFHQSAGLQEFCLKLKGTTIANMRTLELKMAKIGGVETTHPLRTLMNLIRLRVPE